MRCPPSVSEVTDHVGALVILPFNLSLVGHFWEQMGQAYFEIGIITAVFVCLLFFFKGDLFAQ